MTNKQDIKAKFTAFFGDSDEEQELSDVEAPDTAILFSSSEDEQTPVTKRSKRIGKKPVAMKYLKENVSSGSEYDSDLASIRSEDEGLQGRKKPKKPSSHAAPPYMQKTGRQSKKSMDLSDQVQQDEKIGQLVQQMYDVAEKDFKAMESGLPATQKYSLLPKILNFLAREDFHDSLLEHGICAAIHDWLQPYSDGSLPGYDIRKGLLDSLPLLPIEPYHLKDSGLGKIIKALSLSPHETKDNKKQCQKLIYEWSKSLLGQEMDYRLLTAKRERESRKFHRDDGEDSDTERPTAARGTSQYQILPSSHHSMANRQSGNSSIMITASNTPDKYKRLMGHMQKLKAPGGGGGGRLKKFN